jgi:spermidine synthase
MGNIPDKVNWQIGNLNAIKRRLLWLQEQPEGMIFSQTSGIHLVTVKKVKNWLMLGLVERVTGSENWTQSILNLNHPLNLVLAYTQAMMLGLIWNGEPKNIYFAGLGGGSIPLVLHHYFPDAILECAEIDSLTVAVAKKFFGIQLDERLRVIIADARQYLERQKPTAKYDLILIDVAFGNGYIPCSFATQEFYQICRDRLSPEGVIVVNTLRQHGFEAPHLKTLGSVFARVYVCRLPVGNSIFIATNNPPLTSGEIVSKARLIQEQHQFAFPLTYRVSELVTAEELSNLNFEEVAILRDASIPGSYFDPWLF